MALHNKIGEQGEVLASKYLTEKGYNIVDKNWRYQKAEVDIIAINKETLVIIEVKTRTSSIFAKPEEAVSQKKQNLLIEAANAYLEQNNLDLEVRFDIVSIVKTDITHIIDAFYPEL
jgi:putative endonuclease